MIRNFESNYPLEPEHGGWQWGPASWLTMGFADLFNSCRDGAQRAAWNDACLACALGNSPGGVSRLWIADLGFGFEIKSLQSNSDRRFDWIGSVHAELVRRTSRVAGVESRRDPCRFYAHRFRACRCGGVSRFVAASSCHRRRLTQRGRESKDAEKAQSVRRFNAKTQRI